jgi:hypothetical protein
MVNAGGVRVVIIAKLDRLMRSVKDLCGLLELGAGRPLFRHLAGEFSFFMGIRFEAGGRRLLRSSLLV